MNKSRHNTGTLALTVLALIGATLFLASCTPRHDWREIHSERPPYSVLLPAKPNSQTRDIKLGDIKLAMTMTAAEVDHATYAVGCAELADPAAAKTAMLLMKTALVGHLNGKLRKEEVIDNAAESRIDVEAIGTPQGEPRIVVARFIAHQKYAYQIVLTGPEKKVTRDQIDTFMTSFKVK